jgi:DNA-binding transcriptional LysR family regulator
MLNLVAAGRGIAIVPERMTTLGNQGIVFVRLSDEDARSTCALVLPIQPTLLAQTFADLPMI